MIFIMIWFIIPFISSFLTWIMKEDGVSEACARAIRKTTGVLSFSMTGELGWVGTSSPTPAVVVALEVLRLRQQLRPPEEEVWDPPPKVLGKELEDTREVVEARSKSSLPAAPEAGGLFISSGNGVCNEESKSFEPNKLLDSGILGLLIGCLPNRCWTSYFQQFATCNYPFWKRTLDH